MKTVNLNVRISEELRDQFKDAAKKNVQNPSALVRKWIEDYISENKDKEKIK